MALWKEPSLIKVLDAFVDLFLCPQLSHRVAGFLGLCTLHLGPMGHNPGSTLKLTSCLDICPLASKPWIFFLFMTLFARLFPLFLWGLQLCPLVL